MTAGEIEVGLQAGPSIEIVNPDELEEAIAGIPAEQLPQALPIPVSYTHLTLPTNREV